MSLVDIMVIRCSSFSRVFTPINNKCSFMRMTREAFWSQHCFVSFRPKHPGCYFPFQRIAFPSIDIKFIEFQNKELLYYFTDIQRQKKRLLNILQHIPHHPLAIIYIIESERYIWHETQKPLDDMNRYIENRALKRNHDIGQRMHTLFKKKEEIEWTSNTSILKNFIYRRKQERAGSKYYSLSLIDV